MTAYDRRGLARDIVQYLVSSMVLDWDGRQRESARRLIQAKLAHAEAGGFAEGYDAARRTWADVPRRALCP